jgi:hypothetical protein
MMLVEMVAVTLLVLAKGLAEAAYHGGVVQVPGLHVLHEVVLLLGGVEADAALPQAAQPQAHPVDAPQDFIWNRGGRCSTLSRDMQGSGC